MDGGAEQPSAPRGSGGSTFRGCYSRAADPEALIPGGELLDAIHKQLRRTPEGTGQSLDGRIAEATAWSSTAAERFQALADLTDAEGRRLLARGAALGWAPLGLAAGAWLQWLTAPGDADTALSSRILALYARDVGVGQPGAARGSAYLRLLRLLRASEYAVPLARVAGDPRIPDTAFRLPALLLTMSRRPDDFREELIGADLCLRTAGAPPLALVRRELPAHRAVIDDAAAHGDPAPVRQCHDIAQTLIQAGPQPAARVHAGFGWAAAALTSQTDALYDELLASLRPGFAMADLMRLRAREASAYHGQFLLEDRPLSEWLRDCLEDPGPFLDVLARSRLIRPGDSGASPLVGGLVCEHGPMFRVFSPDDLTIIRRWIDALPTHAARTAPTTPAAPAARPSEPCPPAGLPSRWDTGAPPGHRPRDLREAYHTLMARTGSPALNDWSHRYVRGWLARARYRMNAQSVPLAPRWPTEGLRPWLLTRHEEQAAQFDTHADSPLPSREAVVADAVQTAPLTLIDGSWLRGFTDYELASSDIGYSLFATYWDELGNGQTQLNHPLIYREVLREMDIDLPPTASAEFANWPGFHDASFELPVYWLCVGRFPRTFLPEILGLNLAMELSGVGGSYRRASMALREHGFSTRFVDIHNTIDNVATGHSAWAADAIDTLMAGLPDAPGPGSRAQTWERVRAGYRSLSPPGGYLARRAARRARLAETQWGRPEAAAP